MKLYIVKVKWRYEDELVTIGIADAEHVEEIQNKYVERHLPVKDSIVRFDVEEYELNKCW